MIQDYNRWQVVQRPLQFIQVAFFFSIFNKSCLNLSKLIFFEGEVIKTGDFKAVQGEGMPQYRSPFEKGRLIISFNVVFPDSLSPEISEQLAKILPPRYISYFNLKQELRDNFNLSQSDSYKRLIICQKIIHNKFYFFNKIYFSYFFCTVKKPLSRMIMTKLTFKISTLR